MEISTTTTAERRSTIELKQKGSYGGGAEVKDKSIKPSISETIAKKLMADGAKNG